MTTTLTPSSLQERREALLELADDVLADVVAENVGTLDFNRTDHAYFRPLFSDPQWETLLEAFRADGRMIVSEIVRTAGRIKFQQMAGTAAEFATAQTILAMADNVLEKRGPAIEAAIQKLHDELGTLRKAAFDAKADVDRRVKGREYLRTKAPSFIRDRYNRAIKELAARRKAGQLVADEEFEAVESILDYYWQI